MKNRLYYDGECPFCSKYADFLRLKKCANLDIFDARVHSEWKSLSADIRLDDGVIIVCDKVFFQGVEAVNMLLLVCRYEGLFFSMQKYIFKSKLLGSFVYMLFKFFRMITLKFKGVA